MVQEQVMQNRGWLIGIFLGVFVVLTGVSRVWLKRHDLKDILGGWIAGSCVVLLLFFLPRLLF
ncbi:MAG: phosphatase PAP2 family protein, partial [Candidatus Woesearchaeota archaeon]|nr:phosphatase PAP2 family protein [Candidatus Woesearchaeota archaeon]